MYHMYHAKDVEQLAISSESKFDIFQAGASKRQSAIRQARWGPANRSLDVGLRLTWEKVIGGFAWISCILKASDSPWRTSDSSSRTESFQSGICSKASCLSRKNGTKMHKGHQASSSRLCFSNWLLCPLSLVAIDVNVFWPRLRVPLSSRLLLWQTKGCQNGQ